MSRSSLQQRICTMPPTTLGFTPKRTNSNTAKSPELSHHTAPRFALTTRRFIERTHVPTRPIIGLFNMFQLGLMGRRKRERRITCRQRAGDLGRHPGQRQGIVSLHSTTFRHIGHSTLATLSTNRTSPTPPDCRRNRRRNRARCRSIRCNAGRSLRRRR